MSFTSSKSLDEWLLFIENRCPNEIRLGLTRIKTVAMRLSLCNLDACVISVAGTNGKGSTVASLEAIYLAAGYRVGCYTSPHLLRFNERICVNKQPISDDELCKAFDACERARGDVYLTYFEMTTLAALYYFQKSSLDVVILEVGMGGRLDATNIIDANLTIITTIDLDHQDRLGHNVEAIGYEKAGILRANTPFIYADENPPDSVINRAKEVGAPMKCLGSDYTYKINSNDICIFNGKHDTIKLEIPAINYNAAVAAIVASDWLHILLPVSLDNLNTAMKTVSIAGRQQVVISAVTTIFDVAHNPQAVRLLADFIKNRKITSTVHAVFSGLCDKDLSGLIKPISTFVDLWYLSMLPSSRAATQDMLLSACDAADTEVVGCFDTPVMAYKAALQRAIPGDVIVVYGSFLLVSPVMLAYECTMGDLI